MEITYAKVGETSKGVPWYRLEVVDAQGEVVQDVIEANSEQGWLIRYKRDEKGQITHDGQDAHTERVEMEFTIRVRS